MVADTGMVDPSGPHPVPQPPTGAGGGPDTATGSQGAPAEGAVQGDGVVRRRHVFFIAGFDPKSERWYHALVRSQARRQAAVNGMALEVDKARRAAGPHATAWTMRGHGPSGADPVETTFELLQWDDIVRRHWSPSPGRVVFDGLRTVLFGLRDGAVQRMYRLFRPPVYAVFFPLVVLALCSVLAVLGGAGVARLLRSAVGVPAVGAVALGLTTAALLAWLALRAVHRIHITWLLRLVRFTHLQATGRVAALDERLDKFAGRIGDVRATGGVDEVLVVGHSVGATLAIQVLARALDADADLGRCRPGAATSTGTGSGPVALLSLGHCIPLLSALSPAAALRRDLARVAASSIDWLDVSAPIDWAAFPGVDPVAGAGLPAAPPGWHPRLMSPRFHLLFGPQAYARLKRNRFQVHLQYLMAAERPGPYDLFAITAGPRTLRARYDDASPGDGDTPPQTPSP